MPITIAQLHDFFKTIAPEHFSESWDNDGIMLCETPERQCHVVLCALELNDHVMEQAILLKADVIVTHHPFIFKALTSIQGKVYRHISRLMEKHISVLSYHTRLDSAYGGVNDTLAEALMLKNITPFGGENGMLGRYGELEKAVTPFQFADLVKQTLHCGTIRAAFPDNSTIRKVGVIGGAGKDYFRDAKKTGCDAYLSADLSHNTFIDAKDEDLAIFDAGHYYTENLISQKLCDLILRQFPELSVSTYDVLSPYVNL